MAVSVNVVILAGNLTRDPEVRYLPSGMAVAELGIAVNDRVKKDGEWVDQTTFVDVTVWGRQAETANEYLQKGRAVLVEGRLKLDSWESKEGEKRSKLKVVAQRLNFLDSRRSESGGAGEGPAPTPTRTAAPPREAAPAEDEDDLPF